MKILAGVLYRPSWFRAPALLPRTFLGEMSVLLLEGRFAQPRRLVDAGYRFEFANPREAFLDL